MVLRNYKDFMPKIADNVYIDPQASVIGKVSIAEKSSVWPMAVIRGDVNDIDIGSMSSIQDGAVLHVTRVSKYHNEGFNLRIGNRVTIGHNCTIHACTIKDNVLVGMGTCILDGAVVPPLTYIAANSTVPPHKKLTPGLWMGQPVRYIRALTEREIEFIFDNAEHYYNLTKDYT